MSWLGAKDPAEPADKRSSNEKRPGNLNRTEEVCEQQRQEEESVTDAEEGRSFANPSKRPKELQLTRVCVCTQWKKAEDMLEKELLEAEASENKDKKIKLVRN